MIKITIRNRNFNKIIILCLLIALPLPVFALENSNTGVYRPGSGFYLKMDNGSTWNASNDVYLAWDNAAIDRPVAGDWNADGRSETGVYRPGSGFYLKMDNGSTWNASTDVYLAWDNAAGDLPVAGDWNANGRTETGVYRPGSGFYLKMDNGSTWNASTDVYLAWDNAAGDFPVAGDWNADGRTETGVYRPGSGFYLKMDNGSTWNASTDVYLAWDNAAGDFPVAGDWNANGRTETGVYRPGSGFYLKIDNGSTWSASTDRYLPWDNANGDLPIAGPFTINRFPVADFTNITPRSGIAPLTVMFSDLSKNTPTSWVWAFGDSNTTNSTVQNPVHTYLNAGNFTVSLTASNTAGNNTVTISGYITVNPAPVEPVAAFAANPTTGLTPLTVIFTDQSTNTPTLWKWEYQSGGGNWTEFGSGARNPSNVFAAGTYDIRLTASNSGGSNNVTKTGYITVHDIPVAPEAGFITNKRSGTAPLTIRFTDVSTGTEPLTYAWDFDNNGTTDSTDQSPQFVYSYIGNYTVKLTVANSAGSNTTVKTSYITVRPQQSGPHAGVAITFDDNSIENWSAIQSILKDYNANVTFFVSNYGNLDDTDKNMLRTLQADGHEIGYHGYAHLDATSYLKNHTVSEYMSNEIINGVTLMRNDGFNPVDFSFPNGHGDENGLLINALEQHFIHVRSTDGGSIYYPYGSNTTVIYAQGIDDVTYNQSLDTIYNYISIAKANDEIVIFYCHDPVPSNPQQYQVSYDRLQNILANATQNNMKFYTVSELP